MSVAVTHGRTATSVAARRAPATEEARRAAEPTAKDGGPVPLVTG